MSIWTFDRVYYHFWRFTESTPFTNILRCEWALFNKQQRGWSGPMWWLSGYPDKAVGKPVPRVLHRQEDGRWNLEVLESFAKRASEWSDLARQLRLRFEGRRKSEGLCYNECGRVSGFCTEFDRGQPV